MILILVVQKKIHCLQLKSSALINVSDVYRFLFVPTSADVDALNRALYFKNTNFGKKIQRD
jgi:hypothetical protein